MTNYFLMLRLSSSQERARFKATELSSSAGIDDFQRRQIAGVAIEIQPAMRAQTAAILLAQRRVGKASRTCSRISGLRSTSSPSYNENSKILGAKSVVVVSDRLGRQQRSENRDGRPQASKSSAHRAQTAPVRVLSLPLERRSAQCGLPCGAILTNAHRVTAVWDPHGPSTVIFADSDRSPRDTINFLLRFGKRRMLGIRRYSSIRIFIFHAHVTLRTR